MKSGTSKAISGERGNSKKDEGDDHAAYACYTRAMCVPTLRRLTFVFETKTCEGVLKENGAWLRVVLSERADSD